VNATTKFYTGLVIALAIIVSVSFAIGYRTGFSHALRAQPAQHGNRHAFARANPAA
jgi:hypothetical protein